MNKFELPIFDKDGAGEKPARSTFLESTKLSRLPSLPKRSAFTVAATCGNCSKRLDTADEYQAKVKICRICLSNYANIGRLLEEYTTAKIRRNYSEVK